MDKTFLTCHSGGVNSIKTNLQTSNLWTGQYVNYKLVLIEFFTSTVKIFHHFKWISFAISTFVNVEETLSGKAI